MALTGPFYWNGTTWPSNAGGLAPVLITQAQFEECCCCDCDCDGAQPSVSVTGDGTGNCAVSGTIPWSFYFDFRPGSPYCLWYWYDDVNGRDLYMIYCPATESFCARVAWGTSWWGTDADTCGDCLTDLTDIGNPFICVDGKLTGHFSLQGDDQSGSGGPDCSAFTIDVSLNGG